MASITFAERISRGGASDVLILLFSATVRCSEVLSQNDRWTDPATITNCSLSVRPNRVLCWCGASTFQFKFTVEKIPQALTLCSEVLKAFISVLCFETTRILSSFFPSPPPHSCLKTLQKRQLYRITMKESLFIFFSLVYNVGEHPSSFPFWS